MARVIINNSDPVTQGGSGQWFAVERDGKMFCSCGRPIIKRDKDTWMCSYGYPIYRFQEGDIIKDKFGNLFFRKKKHKKDAWRGSRKGGETYFGPMTRQANADGTTGDIPSES